MAITGDYSYNSPLCPGNTYTTGANTNSYWYGQWPQPITTAQPNPMVIYQQMLAAHEQKGKEEKKMRGLFEVYVVDPESDRILTSVQLVAVDEHAARLKGFVKARLDIDLDDVDVIVRRLGDVRPKKEVQEVRVVEDKKVERAESKPY